MSEKRYYGLTSKEIREAALERAMTASFNKEQRAKYEEKRRAFAESEEGKQHAEKMLKLKEEDRKNVETAKKVYSQMNEEKDAMLELMKKQLTPDSSLEEVEKFIKEHESVLNNFSKNYNIYKSYLGPYGADPAYSFFKVACVFNIRFLAFAPKEVLLLGKYAFSKITGNDFEVVRNRYKDLGLFEDERIKKYYTASLKIPKQVVTMDLEEVRRYCKNNPEAYLEISDNVKELLKEELNFKKWCQMAPRTMRYFSKEDLYRAASTVGNFGNFLINYPDILENPNLDNKFFKDVDPIMVFQSSIKKDVVAKVFEPYFDRFPIIKKYCSISLINRAINSEYNLKNHF